MDFETQLFLVIEVDISVAAVFGEFGVIDRTGCTCVFGFLVDQRTGELLSVIALLFVEPSTTIGHFQVGFTDPGCCFQRIAG